MKCIHTLTLLAVVSSLAVACNEKKAEPKAEAPATPAPAAAPTQAAEAKVIDVKVSGDGFTPNDISVKTNEKTTLRFTRTTDETCAKKVVFPELKLEKDLPLNEAVDVEVPTGSARTLAFQCGMGMYKSKVVVN
jgi:plastocyanin domain-containing protein